LEPVFASVSVVVVARVSRSKVEMERPEVHILERLERVRVMKEGGCIKGENTLSEKEVS
jgi:hypothetical protein